MFLIMSAAYVGQELEFEFGKLPPSFLPLGNRRLFQHQVALAPKNVKVYLSIPESFNVSVADSEWFRLHNVKILPIAEGLTLGAAVVAALNTIGEVLDKPLHILYGDTLYKELPTGTNIASVTTPIDNYSWGTVTGDADNWVDEHDLVLSEVKSKKIIDGYFKFDNPIELVKGITKNKWDFIRGLNYYNKNIGINTIESTGWLDFGHVNTYYRSKADFTTQRAFNTLKITPSWIEKSSKKNDKISAEANWFSKLPFSLRGNTPQFLGVRTDLDGVSYRLEYLHLTALNELFVFSKLPQETWIKIISSCIDFLLLCNEEKSPSQPGPSGNDLDSLLIRKTMQRLECYCQEKNITLDTKWCFNNAEKITLNDILIDCNRFLPSGESLSTVLHGDFCFSNILYDFRAEKIKVIDPRGITNDGHMTIYGDSRYDLAKLSHSILGLYDFIIAGDFYLEKNDKNITFKIAEDDRYKDIQSYFIEIVGRVFRLSPENLFAMQIHLFLSMLPLHADDIRRQNALFANAFRLHQILLKVVS